MDNFVQVGSMEQAAPQEGNRGVVAARHGGDSSPAAGDRVLPVRGTGATAAPEFYSGPVRRGDSTRDTRPGTSLEEKNSRGRATRTWPTAASGSETLPEQARRILQGDRDDFRRQRPGATERGRRGFFPSGFPIHVVDLGPLHPFTVIPTAGGEASAAAAPPRFGAAGGAAASRSLRGSCEGYEYE